MASEDPSVRRKPPRSSILRNLIEMYENPIHADNELLASGERNVTYGQKSLASFIGSFVTAISVTPFDVVKIRLQAQEKAVGRPEPLIPPPPLPPAPAAAASPRNEKEARGHSGRLVDHDERTGKDKKTFTLWHSKGRVRKTVHFTGAIDAARKIVRYEGFRSLWSGLSATLAVSLPMTMLYFPMYDSLKFTLGYDPDDPSTQYVPPLSGAICRAVIVVAFNPIEMYRTKIQSESISYRKLLKATKVTYRQRGLAFLLGGVVPSLLRDVPFSGVYWLVYENLKRRMMKRHDRPRPSLLDSLTSGAVAGSLAALTTLPFDVIKTHAQVELGQSDGLPQRSTWQMMKSVHQRSGLRGLYTGAVPRLVKTTPACAIMISTYEGLKTFFIKYNCHRDMKRMQCDDM